MFFNTDSMEYVNFNGSCHIRTKADLMKYALENTYKKDSHGGFACYDYDEALKLYEFFLKFVTLPDTEPSPTEGLMKQLGVLHKEPTATTCR